MLNWTELNDECDNDILTVETDSKPNWNSVTAVAADFRRTFRSFYAVSFDWGYSETHVNERPPDQR